MSVLDKVRRWIDGDTAELVLEEAARDAQVKPHSEAEEFIVKIAREVESVMQREMVPLPQGEVIIPTEYTIFLCEADDKDWQGAKRRGLKQGLFHILSERAREIAGKKPLKTKSFSLELRVDGTLEEREVVVTPGWNEKAGDLTSVGARQNPPIESSPRPRIPTPVQPLPIQTPPPSPNFTNQSTPTHAPLGTPNEAEEMTQVSTRTKILYNLEIWQNNLRQSVIPVFKNEIVIGRGSKSKPVDIALKGDPEISRRHAIILRDNNGNYLAINEGRNAAILDNSMLPLGQRIPIQPGQFLIIGTYALRIQQV